MKMTALLRVLRDYLVLGVIIPPLPFTIVNGAVIDAIPVMADFNAIVGAVNANAAPLTSIPTNLPTFVAAADVGGTGNAITLTPTPAIAGYVAGQRFAFFAAATNTGAVTVNVSGVGIAILLSQQALALQGGELRTNALYEIEYTGAAFNLLSPISSVALNYTPTWTTSGVAPAIGNGSLTGRWSRNGNGVQAVFRALFGTTTTFGTNAWNFSLPVPYVGVPPTLGVSYYMLAVGQPAVYGVANLLVSNPSAVTVLDANGSAIRNTTGAWGDGGSVNFTILYEVAP